MVIRIGTQLTVCDDVILQDNIRDKLRGIAIDASVEIQGATRKRRQSSTAQLEPVLDEIEPKRELVRTNEA